jgi:hypothetical protein
MPLAVETMIAWPPPSIVGKAAFQEERAYSCRANSSSSTSAAVSPWPALSVDGSAMIELRLPVSVCTHSISCEGAPPRAGLVKIMWLFM